MFIRLLLFYLFLCFLLRTNFDTDARVLIGLFIMFAILYSYSRGVSLPMGGTGVDTTRTGSSSSNDPFSTLYMKNRGYRYDPEVYLKSGGMVNYSTHPYDTHPDQGYVNNPYIPPFYFMNHGYTTYNPPHSTLLAPDGYYRPIYNPYIARPNLGGYFPQSLIYNYDKRVAEIRERRREIRRKRRECKKNKTC